MMKRRNFVKTLSVAVLAATGSHGQAFSSTHSQELTPIKKDVHFQVKMEPWW